MNSIQQFLQKIRNANRLHMNGRDVQKTVTVPVRTHQL